MAATLIMVAGCRKYDETCVECNAPIMRIIYTSSNDTIIFDESIENILTPVNSDYYVIEGYQRVVDTLPNSFVDYKNCYPTVVYQGYYSKNPYFFDHYCIKK